MDYERYFNDLSNKLNSLSDTKTITNTIKIFTKDFFKDDSNKVVRYSGNGREFLYDVSVLSFNPKKIIKYNRKSLDTNNIDDEFKSYNAFLLLESELGGESASSAYGIFKNVLEDFSKLLIGNSKHKVMIMALSPYNKESKYIENRLEILKEIYINSDCNSDILIVVIKGDHVSGNSSQIKLDTKHIFGYILDNKNITKICNAL